jgi:hypothetical protein
MRAARLTALALLGALVPMASCNVDLGPLEPPPPPPCNPRMAFYPDTDGDGVGDPGAIYIGCEAPTGYVALPPPADTDAPGDSDTLDSDTDGGGT